MPAPLGSPVPGTLHCVVFRANNLRLSASGEPPDPYVKLRILTIPRTESNIHCETNFVPNTTDPEFNEEFNLNVPDANCSQLEITIWDKKEAKLNSFLGQIIEQDFDVKQGKQYKSKIPAKGKMMMQLEFSAVTEGDPIGVSVPDTNNQSEAPTTPQQIEKPQTPRVTIPLSEQNRFVAKSPSDQKPPFTVDVNIVQARNIIKHSGAFLCISFLNDPASMEQHHFLLLDHDVSGSSDPQMISLPPQFKSKSVHGVDPFWNENCRLIESHPSIQIIEQAKANHRLQGGLQLVQLAGQALLMLVTVHAIDESGADCFCGRIIIPKLHTGHPADQWFMLQGKDGIQLKGPSGQPSALRMRINYGTTTAIESMPLSPTASSIPVAPSTQVQLPPGWEQKLDPSGKIFYVNHQLRTFSWTPPPLPVGTPPPAAATRPTSVGAVDKAVRGQSSERPAAAQEKESSVPASIQGPSPRSRNQSPKLNSRDERLGGSDAANSVIDKIGSRSKELPTPAPNVEPEPHRKDSNASAKQQETTPRAETPHSGPAELTNEAQPDLPKEQENMDWRVVGQIVAGRDLPKINPSALSSPFLCLSILNNAENTDPKQQDRIDHIVSKSNRNEMFTSKGRICRIQPQHTSKVVNKTLNPSWNDEFALYDSHPDFQTLDRASQVRQSKPANPRVKLTGDSVLLLATIHDSAKDDSFIGRFVIPSISRFSSIDQWYTLTNQDGKQQFGINGKPSAICLRLTYEQCPRQENPGAQVQEIPEDSLDHSAAQEPNFPREHAERNSGSHSVERAVGSADQPERNEQQVQIPADMTPSQQPQPAPPPPPPPEAASSGISISEQIHVVDNNNAAHDAAHPVPLQQEPKTAETIVVSPTSEQNVRPEPASLDQAGLVSKEIMASQSQIKIHSSETLPMIPAEEDKQRWTTSVPSAPTQPQFKNEGFPFPTSSYPLKPSPHQAKVVVTIIEGQHFPKVVNNYLCDPFCEICIETKGHGSDIARTTVARNRIAPVWNEQFIFGIDAEQLNVADLKIHLVDWNGNGDSKSIGYIPRIPISEMVKRRQINTWFDILSPTDGKKLPRTIDRSSSADDQGNCALHIVLGFESPVVQAVIGPAPISHVVSEPFQSAISAQDSEPSLNPTQRAPEPLASPIYERDESTVDNGGVGIAMRNGPQGEHVIEFVVEGGPAALSRKVLAGDVLMDIDGLSTSNKSIAEIQSLLRGKPGSPITMTLARSPQNISQGSPLQVVVTLMRQKLGSLTSKSPSRGVETRSPASVGRVNDQWRDVDRERSSPSRNDRAVLISKSNAVDMYQPLRDEFTALFKYLSLDRTDPDFAETNVWASQMLHGIPPVRTVPRIS